MKAKHSMVNHHQHPNMIDELLTIRNLVFCDHCLKIGYGYTFDPIIFLTPAFSISLYQFPNFKP